MFMLFIDQYYLISINHFILSVNLMATFQNISSFVLIFNKWYNSAKEGNENIKAHNPMFM